MQNSGILYGYARVSTDAQDLTSQLAQLKAAGCEKVFREKITGTTADRPQLRKLMAALAHGDVVIIPAVDRLSGDKGNSAGGTDRALWRGAAPWRDGRPRPWRRCDNPGS